MGIERKNVMNTSCILNYFKVTGYWILYTDFITWKGRCISGFRLAYVAGDNEKKYYPEKKCTVLRQTDRRRTQRKKGINITMYGKPAII